MNYKNLSLLALTLLRYNLLILFSNDERGSIVLMSSGWQFLRSTIHLKKENLKNITFRTTFQQRSFTISDIMFGCLYIIMTKH